MFETKTVKEGWDAFSKVIPEDACDAQKSETRMAFYAGALYTFNLMSNIAGEIGSPVVAEKIIDGLEAELHAFIIETIGVDPQKVKEQKAKQQFKQ